MIKFSHLIVLFGVVFVISTFSTNIAFHKFGFNDHEEIRLGVSSIASARKSFQLTSNKKNHNDRLLDAEEEELLPGGIRPIKLLLPPEQIEWIRRRNQTYFDVYKKFQVQSRREYLYNQAQSDPFKHQINATTGFTNYDEDRDKPWMDFLIAGHPKTGTTTLVANLAKVAPMKVKDFCAPKPSTILHFVMDAWPSRFPEIMDGPNQYLPDKSLMLVGSKCPQFIGNPELLSRFTVSHPRMKLIVGIRHPVEWLNSFIRMGHQGNLYRYMTICPHFRTIDPISGLPGGMSSQAAQNDPDFEKCINECRCGLPICFHRSRLHIGLARVGKTDLTPQERNLLAPGDPDGGENLFNSRAKNPIFVYDQTQMKEDSYWDELAAFLGLNYIPNEHYHSSHGQKSNSTLCSPFYDEFRSHMMEHSYNMSVWLEDYFLPLGLDPNRPDVVIANTTSFRELIQTYKSDPCQRLVRNDTNGRYQLDPPLLVGTDQTTFELHAQDVKQCKGKFPKPKDENMKKLQFSS